MIVMSLGAGGVLVLLVFWLVFGGGRLSRTASQKHWLAAVAWAGNLSGTSGCSFVACLLR
jgi:hypothetical protein